MLIISFQDKIVGYSFILDEHGKKDIKYVCYADDAIIIAGNEDDLQRILYQFQIT